MQDDILVRDSLVMCCWSDIRAGWLGGPLYTLIHIAQVTWFSPVQQLSFINTKDPALEVAYAATFGSLRELANRS